MTATKLRQNIYAVLDAVLESGVPAEIRRKGKLLRIVPVEDDSEDRMERLRRLPARPDLIIGDPDELVEIDWSGLWKP
ncbi:MAG TPA: type II toxin-antitoxin system Phd/YefM family antitoxin [Acidimicrobiia bacterium]|nr:type II toxin-antitoxin system Phd/YefM family antitoxin [Acidimicrobiia bacterium]